MTKPTHPRCGWCESLPHGCPAPQACEQADADRRRLRLRDVLLLAATVAAVAVAVVIIEWR